MQLVVVVSSFNLALTFNGHIFSLLIVYFSIITLNKGNVGTNHLNNRILLFVCNRKVIYYYYITLPSITIAITITLGIFNLLLLLLQENRAITYYNYILLLPHPWFGYHLKVHAVFPNVTSPSWLNPVKIWLQTVSEWRKQ